MRFDCTQNILKDKIGECRRVRKFLFIPRSFNSNKTRWLEYTDIVEQVQWYEGSSYHRYLGWIEIGFADEMNKEN